MITLIFFSVACVRFLTQHGVNGHQIRYHTYFFNILASAAN